MIVKRTHHRYVINGDYRGGSGEVVRLAPHREGTQARTAPPRFMVAVGRYEPTTSRFEDFAAADSCTS
jgi:hypothetical protein